MATRPPQTPPPPPRGKRLLDSLRQGRAAPPEDPAAWATSR